MWTLQVLLVALILGFTLQTPSKHGQQGASEGSWFKNIMDTLNMKEVLDDVLKGKATPASCSACGFVVEILKSLSKDEKQMYSVATGVCKDFNLAEPHVCEGLMKRFAPHVSYILHHTSLSNNEACALMIGDACVTELPPVLSWKIPLPPIHASVNENSVSRLQENGTYNVLHLTDVHLDPFYAEGSLAKCPEPLCCRNDSGTPSTAEEAAGMWGDYRFCDCPTVLTENVLKRISMNHKVDYIIWTGDTEPHDNWKTTRKSILDHNRVLTQMIQKYFKNITVFPSIGNHEGLPVNMFSPPDIVHEEFSMEWLYKGLGSLWEDWLDESSEKTFVKHGGHSIKVYPGFRIISLNTNYCNRLNFWLVYNPVDAGGQLQWLVEELYKAENNGEKVHIIGHIAPGTQDCVRVWIRNYYAIIERFQGTVTGQFFGHSHEDEYKIMYDTRNHEEPLSVMYLAPSVTPYTDLNPAYRIYTVDKKSKNVIDHTTYYMDLVESNKIRKAQWKREYSALDAYKMKSLSPEEWHRVTENFKTDEEAFKQFYAFTHRFAERENGSICNQKCRESLICWLQTRDIRNDERCWDGLRAVLRT